MHHINPFIDTTAKMVDPVELGQYLTDCLRAKISDPKAVNAAVAEALNVSENAVYKKLKGINQLTSLELIRLSQVFGISLDLFAQRGPGRVSFEFKPLVAPYMEPLDFMRDLRDNLKAVVQIPGARLLYAASELQIFHYFHFPELTAFKLFVFRRSTWHLAPGKEELSPVALMAHPEIDQLRRELILLYDRVDSVEFWSTHFLANTLNQIDYYAYNFPEENAYYRRLCEQVIQMIHYQKLMAQLGRKCMLDGQTSADSGVFDLFHNEIIHTSNTYLIDSPLGRMVYAVYDNPNAFRTTDPDFCNYTANWFTRLSEKSVPLSLHNEGMRTRYFDVLLQRAEVLQQRLSTYTL